MVLGICSLSLVFYVVVGIVFFLIADAPGLAEDKHSDILRLNSSGGDIPAGAGQTSKALVLASC